MKKISTLIIFVLFPAICLASTGDNTNYPKSASRERWDGFGSVLGNDGGITLFDSNPNKKTLFGDKKASGYALAVNPYLWQAALDIISFMPIQTSDSAGGVITTDWYEDPEYPNERYRVNILIKSIELHVNNLKVNVFKQVLKNNIWREAKPNNKIATDLEEKILTKARELKLSQTH